MSQNHSIEISNENNSQSPFDRIKRIDENGNEYWLARELMNLVDYTSWQKFKKVIESAVENIETVIGSAIEHFLTLEIKSQGRTALDYKLSRLAAYHVALCCDSRGKDSVKAAKHYFAVKTREAELVIPAQSDRLRELELEIELSKLRKEADKSELNLISFKQGLAITDPYMYAIVVDRKPISDYKAIETRLEVTTEDSPEGISLTALMAEMSSLFERTKSGQFKQRDRDLVKQLLTELGINLKTGDGAVKVKRVVTSAAIPPERKAEIKAHLFAAIKQIKPQNVFESAIQQQFKLNPGE